MAEEIELLSKIYNELQEIKIWTRLSGLPMLRRAAQTHLTDDESKFVYELSDGNRSSREIAKELNKIDKQITHVTVTKMWKRWAPDGLVEASEQYQGRYRKVAPIEFLGIEIPEGLKKIRATIEETEIQSGEENERS
ncbi:MAG: hypothetical protein WED07_03285 [Candidatus Freyarchaeum deiterrae]